MNQQKKDLMKELMRLHNIVNDILAEWDPIGVGPDIAVDEYGNYTWLIISTLRDDGCLIDCLLYIITNRMGMDYNIKNSTQVERLIETYRKLALLKPEVKEVIKNNAN